MEKKGNTHSEKRIKTKANKPKEKIKNDKRLIIKNEKKKEEKEKKNNTKTGEGKID